MKKTEHTPVHKDKTEEYRLSAVLLISIAIILVLSLLRMGSSIRNAQKEPAVTTADPAQTTAEPAVTRPPAVVYRRRLLSDTAKGSLVLANQEHLYIRDLTDQVVKVSEKKNGTYLLAFPADAYLLPEAVDAINFACEAYSFAFADTADLYHPSVSDTYRSYAKQEELYQAATDQSSVSAPGASDYQSGYSFRLRMQNDAGVVQYVSSDAEIAAWFDENMHRFGLVERFVTGGGTDFDSLAGKGYYRYVGIPHATYMTENKLSLEQYLAELKEHHTATADLTKDLSAALRITCEGEEYLVFYIPAAEEDRVLVSLPNGYAVTHSSGDNDGGFVLTLTAEETKGTEE